MRFDVLGARWMPFWARCPGPGNLSPPHAQQCRPPAINFRYRPRTRHRGWLVRPTRRRCDIWVHTQDGFYAITAFDARIGGQREDAADLLVIRARVIGDLERIEEWIGSEILATPTADYPFRVIASRAAWTEYLGHATSAVTYRNFKDRVDERLGTRRHDVLLTVWLALRRLQYEPKG